MTTAAVKIDVKPLPSGAPASFGGGVGEFILNVSLNRDSIKAHEAGALMVEISGTGNLNLIETPIVELPADFEKYDVKSSNNFTNGANGMKGKKVFEFPFIPRSEGIFEIPPIEYSYYSISKGKYVTLKSDTLKLKVLQGDANMQGGGAVMMGVNKQQVVNLGNDIRYISTSSPRLVQKGSFFIGSILFYIVVAIIIIFYFSIHLLIKE